MTILTENLIRNIRSSYFGKAPDFLALAKPRVMSLAIFTAIVGMMIAPSSIDATRAIFATIAIAVGAGSAGALNMWYDAGTDSMMSRTANRPIPSGRLSSREALLFGLICATVSIILLAISTNLIAALLLAITILFYAVIYTMWLKFRTPHNIVIGGILFMIIFLWTPPHFWALALYKFRDYENANIPMMPIVAGRRSTQRQIFVYSLALGPVGLMPWMVGSASLFYGVFAAIIGFIFIWHSWKVLVFNPNDPAFGNEKKLFVYSIKYLFLIFAALLVDTVIWSLV